jgi:hypothetical protein
VAEADGNRTRLPALAGTPVLKFVAVRAACGRLMPRRAADLGVPRSFVPSCAVWCRQSPLRSFASRLQRDTSREDPPSNVARMGRFVLERYLDGTLMEETPLPLVTAVPMET